MAREAFKTSDGAVWIQPDGPGTITRFLGCMDVDAISAPGGLIEELTQCFNPDGTGWRVVSSSRTKPGPVTTTLTTYIGEVKSYLEELNCPVTLFFHMRDGGRADIFTNRKRTLILPGARIGDIEWSNLAMRSDDVDSEQKFKVSAMPPVVIARDISAVRQVTTFSVGFNNVVFCNSPRCASDSGPAQYDCQVGYASGDTTVGVSTDVMKTTDGGATWTATTTDPFGTAQVVNGLVCFPISATATRLVAGLGTTVGGAPAKINYSDDGGVTWATAVSVGSTNAQFLPTPHSMFAYDAGNMWVGTSGGYIYKSTDGAKTWTTQNAGTITTGNINSIHFVSDRVGWASAAADYIMRTLDGGSTWSQVAVTGSGSSITKVFGFDSQRAWAATAGGRIYKTLDAGVTWTQARFSGDNAGSVTDIRFINSLVGYITHNSAAPVGTIHRTIDGGYSWEAVTTPTNGGLTGLALCGVNAAWATGAVNAATGVLIKVLN